GVVEQPEPGVDDGLVVGAEQAEDLAGEGDGLGRAGGDEEAVGDGVGLGVPAAAPVAGGGQVVGGAAGVGAVVEQALVGEPGGGAADRGHGPPRVHEGAWGAGEGGECVAGVAQGRPGEEQQGAVLGAEGVEREVGQDPQPAHAGDGPVGGGDGADLVPGEGEVGGGVAGFPVGVGVVDGEVDGLAGHDRSLGVSTGGRAAGRRPGAVTPRLA